jgi:cold shock CspA family protein
LTGVVATFDDHKGYGTVRADDGSEFFFHCTRIAGGTRTIDVGTLVTFDVAPGHLGRWEATSVTAVT